MDFYRASSKSSIFSLLDIVDQQDIANVAVSIRDFEVFRLFNSNCASFDGKRKSNSVRRTDRPEVSNFMSHLVSHLFGTNLFGHIREMADHGNERRLPERQEGKVASTSHCETARHSSDPAE